MAARGARAAGRAGAEDRRAGGLAEDDPDMRARLAGFRQGLERLGWSEGRNVRIDILSNEGEQACGGLIELGAALAGGAQCFIVSSDWWSVAHHPRCRTFPSLDAAATSRT